MKKLLFVLLVVTLVVTACSSATPQTEYVPEARQTATPAPSTTLELIQSMGFVEASLDCESGPCSAFDNDALGIRIIIYASGPVGIFPQMQAEYDLHAQQDFIADVFRFEGLSEEAVEWMHTTIPSLEMNKPTIHKDINKNGKEVYLVMIYMLDKSSMPHIVINIKAPGAGL